MKHRLLCIFLTAALLLSFAGCGTLSGGEDTSAADTTDGSAQPGELHAADIPLSDFVIVRSELDSDGELKSALALRDYIKSAYGIELKMDNDVDHTTNPDKRPDAPEILVGHTNYAETARYTEGMTTKDFSVGFAGAKIVIVGGSADATAQAVEYFTVNCLSADTPALKKSEDIIMKHEYPFAEADISVVSLNLRTAKNANENTQSEREPLIVAFVDEYKPDSLGTQECEVFWRGRLDKALAPIGYDRAVPAENITKNYIWYNTKTLKVIEADTFWLSPTPEVSSKGFGSNFYISCCWAVFEVIATGTRYVHMNTHLDVNSEKTRESELTVLIPRIEEFLAKDYAVVVTGDFNSKNDSVIYTTVTELLSDSRLMTKDTTDIGTFNNFDYNRKYSGPIDYCFVDDDVSVSKYSVIDKQDGKFMSDHNALRVLLTLYKR